MTFITPWLAAAGAMAMVIPIAIHLLFRQRRKPVMWAAMRLLMEAYRKQRTRLRLQQFVLLALRCLGVALLGAALAQPLLQSAGVLEGGGTRLVYLVIDNGIASGAADAEGATALEKHVASATTLLESMSPGDTVGVILAAHPARVLLSPPSGDLRAVASLLESLEPAQTATDLDGALRLLEPELAAGRDQAATIAAYLFSDFRRGAAPLAEALGPTLTHLSRVGLFASSPAENSVANIQVRDVSPLRAVVLSGQTDGSGQVTVRLARSGSSLGRDVTQVRLTGEGIRPIAPRAVQWEEGREEATAEFVVRFAEGEDREVGLTAAIDADGLAADNERHGVLESRDQIRVTIADVRRFGALGGVDDLTSGQWIRWALRPGESAPMEIVEIEPGAVDARALRVTDAVVIARPDLVTDQGWADLREFFDRGGLLVVTPPGEAAVHLWLDRLAEALDIAWEPTIEPVRREEGIALAADQPGAGFLRMLASDLSELCRPVRVYQWLRLDVAQPADRLLVLEDGSPLIAAGSGRPADGNGDPSRGLLILFAAAPELRWTNLPSKPLMVPLMQELVREGLGAIRASRITVVGERPIVYGGRAAQSVAELHGPSEQVVPVDRNGQAAAPLSTSGVYRAVDAAGQPVGRLAVNIDPEAARTDVQPADAVLAWLRTSGAWSYLDMADPIAPLRTADAASPLSGYLLPVVLGIMVLEAVLAGWWSPWARGRRLGFVAAADEFARRAA
jgi:hypothetical protein